MPGFTTGAATGKPLPPNTCKDRAASEESRGSRPNLPRSRLI